MAPLDLGERRSLLCGGRWSPGSGTTEVTDPDTGETIAEVALTGLADLEAALAAAARAVAGSSWSAEDRTAVLAMAADRVSDLAEQFATLIAMEGIKTIREARAEVRRAVGTLRLSAAAVPNGSLDALSAEDHRDGTSRRGTVRSQPVGVVAAITPYNDPLNLVVHKVGPALAAGNAVIVKPDARTPLSALLLGEVLSEAGVPSGRLSVLPADAAVASALVADPRVRFVSFTGGRETGARVHRAAGVKRVLMELGGICPTIVFDDADLDIAVPALMAGAYGAAGQNCLHVQRILVHRSRYAAVRDRLIEAIEEFRCGPKIREDCDMGPLIDVTALNRVAHVVAQARGQGARLLCGGSIDGPRYLPTLLENVPHQVSLAREEVFGPVTTLEPFDTDEEAVALANRGGGGIHAGLFTSRPDVVERFLERLDFGGVVVGGTSDHRFDSLPFGGTGLAGIGREGVSHAVAAMSETKTLISIAPGPVRPPQGPR